MPRMPVISGDDLIKALRKIGWVQSRQKGSHRMLTKAGERVTLSIPDHDELAPGTLRQLLHAAALSVEDLLRLLDR